MIFTCILDSATVGQILYTCPGVSERSPQTSGFICRKTLTLSALPVPFQHNDKYVLLIDEFFTLPKETISLTGLFPLVFFLSPFYTCKQFCPVLNLYRKRYVPDKKLSLILIFFPNFQNDFHNQS